jgi:NADH dehydrogenase
MTKAWHHWQEKAVVDLPKYHFNGVFAWFVWMFVHLFSLVGFKEQSRCIRLVYNYIRLIVRKAHH